MNMLGKQIFAARPKKFVLKAVTNSEDTVSHETMSLSLELRRNSMEISETQHFRCETLISELLFFTGG